MTQAVRRSPRVAALLSGWALCLLATFSATAAHAAEPAAPSPRREVAPGDFAPISVPMPFGTAGPASLSPHAATGSIPQPDIVPPGTCTFTALPNDNSTSGNERCPMLRNRFGRSVYLITASELAANGLVSGSSILGIGWSYQTAQGLSGSGPLIVYLQNTSDATNLKSTTWATAITGMTVVHNATTTLPSPAGPFDIPFSGGSPFTYTGGALYVAFDMQYPVGTLSATTVAWCNSLGLVNGLLGAQGTTAPTTLAASSFRPETRFTAAVPTNDAAVSLLVSYGQVPLGLSGAQAIQAIVVNKGNSTLTNLPVTLTITGAESFTDTQIIPSLASCGAATTVTFAPFTPTVLGSDLMTISVPADDNNANNSQSKTLTVTLPTESYKYVGTTSTGGFGFTGASGAFVCKFTTVAASNITEVIPEFAGASATTYRIAIFKDSGVGTPGLLLYVDAANRTVGGPGPVTITLPAPVPVGPGTFFVGIEQTNTTNANLAFDTEAPVRPGTFFLGTGLPPATWSDFAPGNNFKPNVGITLDRCNNVPALGNNGPLCDGGTLQLTASAAGAASYSWTGPNGFTSNQQNPSVPTVSALNAGIYTCTVNGCALGGSATTNVAVNTGPYSITASAGGGGSISPGSVSVACGGSQAYTITPDPCSTIQDVVVDGVSQGAIPGYTFTNVTANHTLSAAFSTITYAIVSSAGAGGSIAPLGSTPVACGGSQGYTITPAPGYQIADVLVDGVSQGAIPSYAFNTVGAGHTIAASFTLVSAVVAGTSSAAIICPTNSCVTIPVNLTRPSSTNVLAFSVTFQLSPDLSLCSGVGSVTEGTFLSAVGATLFQVVSLGSNTYRADGALTANCGATATSGLLFDVGVTSSGAGGTGSLTVTAAVLRDCGNHSLPAAAGAPATVAYDNQAPTVAVTSPNGGESLTPAASVPITWSASDNVGVSSIDLAYSTDGGITYPNTIATALPNTGSYSWTVPNTPSGFARVRATAHDTGCSAGADASDANFTIIDVLGVGPGQAPHVTALQPATPNPFRNSVTLGFTLAAASQVQFDIFSVGGRRVKAVASGSFDAGGHDFTWDGRDEGGNAMAAGVYYARLMVGPTRFSRRITLLR
ncbi:MAG TPA: FlgD immunoglobulin-like domain containing protein [Verrucomicrobiae bacterium]|nr:FlgD immunoglobulin-like domain containing protein [Verrucomicrobiae bacterium]